MVTSNSEGCDNSLAVDFDGVDGARADGDMLVKHCGTTVVDFGLATFCQL